MALLACAACGGDDGDAADPADAASMADVEQASADLVPAVGTVDNDTPLIPPLDEQLPSYQDQVSDHLPLIVRLSR